MTGDKGPVREPGSCWAGWSQVGEGDGTELHGPKGERVVRLAAPKGRSRLPTRRWAAYRPDGTILRTLDGREQRYLSAVSACFALG